MDAEEFEWKLELMHRIRSASCASLSDASKAADPENAQPEFGTYLI